MKKRIILSLFTVFGLGLFSLNFPVYAEDFEDEDFKTQILSEDLRETEDITSTNEYNDEPVLTTTSVEEDVVEPVAETTENKPIISEEELNELIELAGLTPDDFWYFADRFGEKLQLTFTFDDEKKAELSQKFAIERLAEIEKLPEDKRAEYLPQLVADYSSSIKVVGSFIESYAREGVEIPQTFAEQAGKVSFLSDVVFTRNADSLNEETLNIAIKETEDLDIKLGVIQTVATEDLSYLLKEDLSFNQLDLLSQVSDLSGLSPSQIFNQMLLGETGGLFGDLEGFGSLGSFDLYGHFNSDERIDLSSLLESQEGSLLGNQGEGLFDMEGFDSILGEGLDSSKWEEMKQQRELTFPSNSGLSIDLNEFELFDQFNLSTDLEGLEEKMKGIDLYEFIEGKVQEGGNSELSKFLEEYKGSNMDAKSLFEQMKGVDGEPLYTPESLAEKFGW